MMKTHSSHWFILLSLLAVALTACGGPATTSPQPTAGPTETRVAETPSPAKTVTPTLAPTETPTPPPLDLADAEIAYLDMEDHLWLMNADGTARRQLTQSGAVRSPTWSPDGQTLAYIYYDEYMQGQTMLHDMQRGETRAVGPVLEFLTNLSWSPDSRYLLLDMGTGIIRSLHMLEIATGEVIHHLTSMFSYGWASDSNALVLGQRQPLDEPISYESLDSVSLSVWEVGAAEPQIILQGNAEVLYFPAPPMGHGWLPDGHILYTRLDWDEDTKSGDESLWTVTWEDGALGEPQPAADIPLRYDLNAVQERIEETVNVPVTGFISWAPDDRHLVFQAGTYPNYGIYLLDWESDDPPRCLVDGYSPAWRPVPVTAMPAILDVYPLAVGTTWVYSVTLDENVIGHWTGPVTETVTSVEQQGEGLIFRAELDTEHPLLVQPRERRRCYVALDDRLYRLAGQQNSSAVITHDGEGNESAQILTWPLEIGQQWGEPEMLARGDSGYVWQVMAQEPVTTPAGTFEDCYRLKYVANTGYEQRWFCPGVGIVRQHYHHNGSLWDETWEMQATNAQEVLCLCWEDVLTPLTPSQAASSFYQPVVEPRAAVAALLANGLRWLNAGGEPADLAAALNAPIGESADAITVMERDLTGGGRGDVLLHSTFMGMPLLVFVNRGGSPARFAGYALPADFAETISNGWPTDLRVDSEGIEQPALQMTDLTGDGMPEVLLSQPSVRRCEQRSGAPPGISVARGRLSPDLRRRVGELGRLQHPGPGTRPGWGAGDSAVLPRLPAGPLSQGGP